MERVWSEVRAGMVFVGLSLFSLLLLPIWMLGAVSPRALHALVEWVVAWVQHANNAPNLLHRILGLFYLSVFTVHYRIFQLGSHLGNSSNHLYKAVVTAAARWGERAHQ